MTRTRVTLTALSAALLLSASAAFAQSGATRPRRVTPTQPAPAPAAPESAVAQPRAPQPQPAQPAAQVGAQGTVGRALSLLEQKQFEAALTEARALTERDPRNSDGWKIAGFAGYGLKRYAEAAADLQRAAELQKAAGKPDRPTDDLLAEAYFLAENYERALPLLAAATAPAAAAKPDARLLYYRAVAEQKTGRAADAERTYGEVLKAEPKNTSALYNLGLIAYGRNDHTAAINYLNRATLSDPRLESAWKALVNSYLRRAATLQGPKAEADYLAAVRAGESLQRLRDNAEAQALLGQALLYAKQFVRAAAQLERASASPEAPAGTDYLLGYAHVQAKSFPKAAAALERAAQRTPDNADVYRLLGFAYESSKEYGKALRAYENGLRLAPADDYFKESAERVRPFAK